LKPYRVNSTDPFTITSFLLGQERYFDIPNLRTGIFHCRISSFSLNRTLAIGLQDGNLTSMIDECEKLSGNFASYLITRKRGSKTFIITKFKNFEIRVQPYLFCNGILICEFENFLRVLERGV